MFVQQAFVYLAAATLASASIVAVRIPLGNNIEARAVQQGWSLQASSAPAGTTSCGGGSFCPSSLKCYSAATLEVASCCSSSVCRGDIEGSPVCADDSWNLWKGANGNGFCCTTDLVGQYDSSKQVAGSCVSAVSGGATSAQLQSTGSGGAAQTSAPAAATSAAAASTNTATAAASGSTAAAVASAASAASAASSASSSSAASATAGAASSAAAASSSSSANSTGTATAAPKSSSGAERLASGFGLVVLAAGAMFAL